MSHTIFGNNTNIYYTDKTYKDGRIRVIRNNYIYRHAVFGLRIIPLDKPVVRIIKKQPPHRLWGFKDVYESNGDLFFPITKEEEQELLKE